MRLLTDRRYRDLSLLILGLAGLIWFIIDLPGHHPMAAVEITEEPERVISRVDSVLAEWGFPEGNSMAELGTYEFLLDSAISRGFPENGKALDEYPAYHWQIREVGNTEENTAPFAIRASLSGDLIGVEFPGNYGLSSEQNNREAYEHVIDSLQPGLSAGNRDSLFNGLLSFQQLERDFLGRSLASLLRPDQDVVLLMDDSGNVSAGTSAKQSLIRLAEGYASYYLQQSGWRSYEFDVYEAELIETPELRFAQVSMRSAEPILGAKLELLLEVTPAGGLKTMKLQTPQSISDDSLITLESLRVMGTLLFGLWLLIVFYLRIKAKAIDTQPALVMAVLFGFLIPGVAFLFFSRQLMVFASFNLEEAVPILFTMGITGAVGAVGFFMLTSVSDSITRQYWAEKLKTWDLVRRGLFKNQPTGWALLGSIAIGSLLTGIWELMLHFLPVEGIGMGTGFLGDLFTLPSVAAILISLVFSLTLVISLFLIVSNQIYGLTGKRWLIPIVGAAGFALFGVSYISIEPSAYGILINAVLGLVLGLLYLKYDLLTVAGGFFVYFGLMLTSTGWLPGNSPDSGVTVIFGSLMVFMGLLGAYFIFKGTDREHLPEYIPAYIEDQAKEQRVRQELAIARVVQETFLPSKVERLKGLDIAGVCIPAQDTGGDYYDMISLGSNRTALAIGDVSGKGIKAAFYMTFTKGVLHSLSAIILSPLELLNQLNRLFNENATRGTFISMIYGILEADRRMLTFARAGHNPILVVHEDGSSEWLNSKGVGIGVSKGEQFIRLTEEVEYKIREGDVIVLYTDGITEMMDSGGRFYGEDRFKQLVNAIKKDDAQTILKKITGDVREFKGAAKQHDDMTLLVIKADSRIESPF